MEGVVCLFVFRLCSEPEITNASRKVCGKAHPACVLTFLWGGLAVSTPNLKCVRRLRSRGPAAGSFS